MPPSVRFLRLIIGSPRKEMNASDVAKLVDLFRSATLGRLKV